MKNKKGNEAMKTKKPKSQKKPAKAKPAKAKTVKAEKAKPKARPGKKHPGGRPTVMTEAVVAKLEEAFSLGASDEMACKFAGVSKNALYDYCAAHPEFSNRKEQLKSQLVMKCLYSLNAGIEEDPELAFKVLERKSREDFGKVSPDVAVNVSPTTVVAMPEPKGLASLTTKELAAIAAEVMKDEGDDAEIEPPAPPSDHEEPEQGEEIKPETDTAAEIEPPEPGEDEWGWA